jgi:hypothetical protein
MRKWGLKLVARCASHSVASQLDMREEQEKRGLVYIIVCLVGLFFKIYLKLFLGKNFTVFEVLEKNLEASFYFSFLPKKTKKNNGEGVLLFSVKL